MLEIICQVWLKITCGQSLWRQKMIEVKIAILFTHFIFLLEDECRRKTHSCSVVGKGQSRAVVSVGALGTGGCQCSKGGVVFLCSAPAPAQPLLWSSASSGLPEELWIVAVMLYFKNAAVVWIFWIVTRSVLRFPTRHSQMRLPFEILLYEKCIIGWQNKM